MRALRLQRKGLAATQPERKSISTSGASCFWHRRIWEISSRLTTRCFNCSYVEEHCGFVQHIIRAASDCSTRKQYCKGAAILRRDRILKKAKSGLGLPCFLRENNCIRLGGFRILPLRAKISRLKSPSEFSRCCSALATSRVPLSSKAAHISI